MKETEPEDVVGLFWKTQFILMPELMVLRYFKLGGAQDEYINAKSG